MDKVNLHRAPSTCLLVHVTYKLLERLKHVTPYLDFRVSPGLGAAAGVPFKPGNPQACRIDLRWVSESFLPGLRSVSHGHQPFSVRAIAGRGASSMAWPAAGQRGAPGPCPALSPRRCVHAIASRALARAHGVGAKDARSVPGEIPPCIGPSLVLAVDAG